MAQLWRVTADWSGGKIGTGYTNHFYAAGTSTAQLCADTSRKFFADSYSAGALLPSGISISFRPQVDIVEETNGELTGQVSVTAPATVTGSDASRYSAVAGACVTWSTGDFIGGHRVRGRTFLVPLGGAGLATDGTIDTTALGFINTAAAAVISAAPEFRVWRRPTSHAASDGSSHLVGGGTCRDRTCFLTSRR